MKPGGDEERKKLFYFLIDEICKEDDGGISPVGRNFEGDSVSKIYHIYMCLWGGGGGGGGGARM